MEGLPISALVVAFFVLLGLSAFFSASETGMMTLNRYRLRHLVEKRIRGAVRAQKLLERPDRLIGLILLGSNFVNTAATTIGTLISIRLLGPIGPLVAAGVLTVMMLIFTDTMPKTLAALHPERIAFPASAILRPLLFLSYPLVWLLTILANAALRLFGVSVDQQPSMALTREELRTVVREAGALIPGRHREMLFGLLDLERITVADVMVPRNDIDGLDLDQDPADLREQLIAPRHTRLPCYYGTLDNLAGILHVRKLPRLIESEEPITAARLAQLADDPYFIPDGTDLQTQLLNFQSSRQRLAVVVDEYGDIEGLVTMDDLLEQVVGEFTTKPQSYELDIYPQADGTFLIDGGTAIRDLNRRCGWHLPETGPRTLNGLILEELESIPDADTSLRINGYTIEIENTIGQTVRTARVRPPTKA